MSVPQRSTLATQDIALDAARYDLAEAFPRVTQRTISNHLDVRPREIPRGYKLNVLLDQYIMCPNAHRG